MPQRARTRGRRRGARAATRRLVALTIAVNLAATACTGGSGSDDATADRRAGTGDTYEATIRRTEDGVAHVTGATIADVTFGQGWASGTRRACTLAERLLTIQGERSRWFGPGTDDANLRSDIAWRIIGIVERATTEWEQSPADVRAWVRAYADGWNAQLEAVGVDGLRGWCAGAEWVRPVLPVEVYAASRAGDLDAGSAALVPQLATAAPPPTTSDAPDERAATAEQVIRPRTTPTAHHGPPAPPGTGRRVGGTADTGDGPAPARDATPTTAPHAPATGDVRPGTTTGTTVGTDAPTDGDPPTGGGGDRGGNGRGDDDQGGSGAPGPRSPAAEVDDLPRPVPAPGDTTGDGTGAARGWSAGGARPRVAPVSMAHRRPDPDLAADRHPGPPATTVPADPVPAPRHLGPIRPADHQPGHAWAIGRERSAGRGGMLLAAARPTGPGDPDLVEVHLTVPGVVDAYGAQVPGLPGLAAGFGKHLAWTRTATPGAHLTAYRLDLVPGDPTAYRYGDDVRHMTSRDITVDVRAEDGTVEPVTHTAWSTHHGPLVNLPGVGWTASTAVAVRDANIGNDESLAHALATLRARTLDELITVHDTTTGVASASTLAVADDGRAWYGATAATPDLSGEALARHYAALTADPAVRGAADQGIVLLDGTSPADEWRQRPGARDLGLVPPSELPQLTRDDYLFDTGDSFWLPHAEATVEGAYSPLLGDQHTARSLATRTTAGLLADTSPDGPAGGDGRFTLDELTAAALSNRSYTATALLDAVVARCDGAPPVRLPALLDDTGAEVRPTERVYVGAACAVLAGWDGTFDADQPGPLLWRALTARLGPGRSSTTTGLLWARPFDPARPATTPGGLAPALPGGPDPVLRSLGRAVQTLEAAGIPVDTRLGEVQRARGGSERVPLHGGLPADGVTNTVVPDRPAPATAPGRVTADPSAFRMAVSFTAEGPAARTLTVTSDPADRRGEPTVDALRRYAAKEWRDVVYAPTAVAHAAETTLTVRG